MYVGYLSYVSQMGIFMNHLKSNSFFSKHIKMNLRHQKYKN